MATLHKVHVYYETKFRFILSIETLYDQKKKINSFMKSLHKLTIINCQFIAKRKKNKIIMIGTALIAPVTAWHVNNDD